MEKFKSLIESKAFIVFISCLAFLNWVFDKYIVFTIILCLLTLIIVLLDVDRSIVSIFFLVYIIAFSNQNEGIRFYFYYGGIAAIVIILLIDAIIHKTFTFKCPIIYCMIISCIISLLSVIPAYIINPKTVIHVIVDTARNALWISPIGYFLAKNNNIVNSRKNVSFAIFSFMLCIFAQTLYYIINTSDWITTLETGKSFGLRWTDRSTYISMIYCVCIPFIIYLYYISRNGIFLTFSLIPMLMTIIMRCRGSILGLIPMLVFIIIFLIIKTEKKKRLLFDTIIFFIIPLGIVTYIGYQKNIVETIIKEIFARGIDSSGRKEIFELGIDLFKKHPILGTGAFTSTYYVKELTQDVIHYHNIFIQALACTGILGFLALLLYITTLFIYNWRNDFFNIMCIALFIYLIFHGLVDTTFNQYRIMVLLMVIIPYMKQQPIKKDIEIKTYQLFPTDKKNKKFEII